MDVVNKIKSLYDYCIPISSLTCDTVDFKIFQYDKSIRFCNSKELLNHIPIGTDKRFDSFYGFIHDNPYFWIIPLKTAKDTFYGFILKSYDKKEYRNFICKEHVCLFYGFNNFSDYKQGTPIILTEGIKDCIVLKQYIYPYSLACLTSGLSGLDDIKVIKKLTDKVILLYDLDNAGRLATKRDVDRLAKEGIRVFSPLYHSPKDIGDLFNDPIGLRMLQTSVVSTLNLLS